MKSKLISAMIVMALIMSTFIVMEKAEAVPGNNEWGIATEDLVYDDSNYVDVEINTSSLNTNDYYVLYPVYGENQVTWKKYMAGGSPVLLEVTDNSYDATEILSSSVLLNVSGLWVLSEAGTYDGSTSADYFWVNSTQHYEIELTSTEVTYNENQDITITVTDGNTSVACWIDLIREVNESKIFHRYEPDGTYTFDTELLEWAGNYTIQAYRDIDDQHEHGYASGKGYYDSDYGSSGLCYINYNYTNCGPWDPPEYMAENKQIISKTNEPQVSLDHNKVYWSFNDELNITLTDFDEDLFVYVTNTDDENVTSYLDLFVTNEYIRINNSAKADATTGGWGRDCGGNTYGENGTWHIYLFLDVDGDGTEEWNTTLDFKVLSPEGVQWFWISDDEILEIPEIGNQPLEVKFQIIGDDHSFYGDGSTTPVIEFGKNITISGNSLFTGKLSEIPGVSYNNGTWTVLLTPIMTSSDRTITFEVDWEGYGTLKESLNVGGTELNGTIVEISPTSFVIDEEVTLEVSIFGPDGIYEIRNANVELYWLDNNGIHTTLIESIDKPDNPETNVYSFLFNITEQHAGTTYVPRNIIAYTHVDNIGNGYAKTEMKPKSDLRVNISKDVLMAGEKTEFDINVFVGNGTSQPDDGINFEFYDSNNDLVILNASFGSLMNSDLDDVTNSLDDYILVPGVYTIYVYNDTHDSTGHNATLIVKGVDVSCDLSPFIWKYDDNISAIFTIQYEGQLINGTLKIYNIFDEGDYYSTWVDTGDNALTFDVDNGKVQIDNITANKLPIDVAKENITFKFRPEESGSDFAEVDDKVSVKIADISVSPEYVSYEQTASIEITITGRGTLLEDVLVGLEVPGISGIMESRTLSNGIVTFAFVPTITGKIKVFVEERESDKIIEITAWSLTIEASSQVDEDKIFTVVVKDGVNSVKEGVSIKFNGVTKITNSVGEVSFIAPKVTSDRYFVLKAEKEGYASDEITIEVSNVPILKIIADISEILVGKTFTIVVADDEGKSIVGAIVSFGEKVYTTGANGIATLVAPTTSGNHSIGATFEGYANANPVNINVQTQKTPGFEIIIFIASLGVALILLKKRK